MHVSVVVISRNGGPRLALSLVAYERAVAQAARHGIDSEIVVVDDGSTDDTPRILDRAAAALPLVVLRNSPGVGIAEARNRGAAAATGEILLFMDGDVLLCADGIVAHVQAHRERAAPAVVRGAAWHLRCTRALLDPQTGTPFPGQEGAVARIGHQLPRYLVTAAQVREDFAAIVARAKPGIYVGSANADLHAAEIDALERDGGRDVCWMSVPGHNVSMPRDAFLAVGGYHEEQIPLEQREIALRLAQRGLDIAIAPRAHSYHLTHQSHGRDPLNGPQQWLRPFYTRHPVLSAKLMLIFWHTLSRTGAIPEAARIESILDIARIVREGSSYDYERVFDALVARSTLAPAQAWRT